MTERPDTAADSFVVLQDDVLLKGKKRATMVCIVESGSGSVQPEDLKETIESLIEDLLRRDGRFDDLACEVGRYREIVFTRPRSVPFTMIEARAVMTTMRKWRALLARRLAD